MDVLVGYKATLCLTPPASMGKPRAKQCQDLNIPTNYPPTPAGLLAAQQDTSIARQALQMVELGMLAGPGLDPGQSNLTFNTNIVGIYVNFVTMAVTQKPA